MIPEAAPPLLAISIILNLTFLWWVWLAHSTSRNWEDTAKIYEELYRDTKSTK